MMPISAQQWRVAVGKMNANKRCPEKRQKSSPAAPREGSPRKPSGREERREYVANLLTVLYAYFLALRSIVSDVFRSERDRDESEGSTKKMKAKGKGLHGSLVMLLRLLLFITALLLLMGGDVERNPGPPKRGELEQGLGTAINLLIIFIIIIDAFFTRAKRAYFFWGGGGGRGKILPHFYNLDPLRYQSYFTKFYSMYNTIIINRAMSTQKGAKLVYYVVVCDPSRDLLIIIHYCILSWGL